MVLRLRYCYMLYNKHNPVGVETMMSWTEFITGCCSGIMNTETETPENRGRCQSNHALYLGDEFFIAMDDGGLFQCFLRKITGNEKLLR